MSKEEVKVIVKKWERLSLDTALNHICVILCTKEPSVIGRIVVILEKCDCCTGRNELMFLKGGTTIVCIYVSMCIII